jgi:hypothetical protein
MANRILFTGPKWFRKDAERFEVTVEVDYWEQQWRGTTATGACSRF